MAWPFSTEKFVTKMRTDELRREGGELRGKHLCGAPATRSVAAGFAAGG
jgi:hypothetical protein